jgi:mRNA-degrading endonuclease RelE of RelBE toxin-antitoxin system
VSFEVVPLRPFEKQLKRLVRKYPSLRAEFMELADQLSRTPRLGIGIGNSCFKIRLSIASKGAGRSGGARVITHVRVSTTRVYLLSIYDKSEKDTLTPTELRDLLSLLPG